MPPASARPGPGQLVAGRYRLQSVVPAPPDARAALWRARDEVLARPVAVTLLDGDDPAAGRLLAAAARAGAVGTRAATRLYDAAVQTGPAGPLVYLVREWVDGVPLAQALLDGPLTAAEAVRLATQAADAVAGAHAVGTVHGRLHPGNLVLSPGGLRITDTAVGAAVRDGGPGTADGDVRDLAALLYALLTGCWPLQATVQPARGLPPAPVAGTGPRAPRLVRAGVPRSLDRLVVRALAGPAGGGPASAADLCAALETAAGDLRPAVRPAPRRRRRGGRLVAGAALLAALATVSYALGLAVGEAPASQRGPGLAPAVEPAPEEVGTPGCYAETCPGRPAEQETTTKESTL